MDSTPRAGETVLKALSNSTRREIMKEIVARGGATYTEMMEVLGLNPSVDSGRFNYHLKELADAGLIRRSNTLYRITDLGKKALILIDQVSRDAKIDRYGVLHAAISMNPREELRLFKGQFGLVIGFFAMVFGVVLGLAASNVGPLEIGLSASLITVSFLILGWSLWTFGSIVGRYKLGLSSLLLLDSDWFLIRSPNRGTFMLMMISGIAGILLAAATFALIDSGVVSLVSPGGFVLVGTEVFLWIAFIGLMMKATRRIELLERMDNR